MWLQESLNKGSAVGQTQSSRPFQCPFQCPRPRFPSPRLPGATRVLLPSWGRHTGDGIPLSVGRSCDGLTTRPSRTQTTHRKLRATRRDSLTHGGSRRASSGGKMRGRGRQCAAPSAHGPSLPLAGLGSCSVQARGAWLQPPSRSQRKTGFVVGVQALRIEDRSVALGSRWFSCPGFVQIPTPVVWRRRGPVARWTASLATADGRGRTTGRVPAPPSTQPPPAARLHRHCCAAARPPVRPRGSGSTDQPLRAQHTVASQLTF